MNAQPQAYKDYALSSSIKSTKDIESEIILEITRKLKSADQGRKCDYASFVQAVQANRKLWTLLASDVAQAGNALPADLKARIFFLGEFVQDHSRKVLRDGETIAPLLDINLAILRGLGSRRQER